MRVGWDMEKVRPKYMTINARTRNVPNCGIHVLLHGLFLFVQPKNVHFTSEEMGMFNKRSVHCHRFGFSIRHSHVDRYVFKLSTGDFHIVGINEYKRLNGEVL